MALFATVGDKGVWVAIFKYFTEEAHALAFINKGELMMQSLSHFRALEDEEVRGDRHDGVLIYAPPDGVAMNMEDGRTVTVQSFNSTVRQNDIFVYCTSHRLSAELAKEFGPFCVEISDPEVLVRRLKLRAHPTSQFDYEQLVSGPVDYRAHDRKPGVDWTLPERLVLMKPDGFARQNEFRIAVGKRGTFDVGNVGLTIQTGPAAPAAAVAVVPHPILLRIGKLADRVILHRFEL